MFVQLLVGLVLVVGATVAVTKFILEVNHMPVVSDDEWDIEMAKRSPFLDIPAMHMPVDPPEEVGDVEMGNLVR